MPPKPTPDGVAVSGTVAWRKSAPTNIHPRRGTRITGDGVVQERTISRMGLHRVVIVAPHKYPDLHLWLQLLGRPALAHWYDELLTEGGLYRLHLFWKE